MSAGPSTSLERGSIAAITGAASGIGRALALDLAGRGVDVALLDLAGSALAETADLVSAMDVRALPLEVDVRSQESVSAAATRVAEDLGDVDLLCNNAGVLGPFRPVWEQSASDWRWVHEVNLLGVVHGIVAFVPAMIARGSGHVLNTASINSLVPLEVGGNGPYAASKAGALAVSEVLRTDLGRAAPAIGVTVALPGPVLTNIRQSERWRPDELPAVGPSEVLPTVEFGYERITPETAAERILAAVERGDRYVLPNHGSEVDVRAAFAHILGD
ncbi:SDR family NAD(P)-dependent oxidoreductase [Nocardioides sediminis]|uniref:SDR family NAD(P)-dependent oxidoreductase n=1 Tax=Nocardioides sediminis TaxID=433648 RepID=UPI00131F0F99|nr:SDR family NAD(P)-dependent oxidoreductase [Nocardioides sediminis]